MEVPLNLHYSERIHENTTWVFLNSFGQWKPMQNYCHKNPTELFHQPSNLFSYLHQMKKIDVEVPLLGFVCIIWLTLYLFFFLFVALIRFLRNRHLSGFMKPGNYREPNSVSILKRISFGKAFTVSPRRLSASAGYLLSPVYIRRVQISHSNSSSIFKNLEIDWIVNRFYDVSSIHIFSSSERIYSRRQWNLFVSSNSPFPFHISYLTFM